MKKFLPIIILTFSILFTSCGNKMKDVVLMTAEEIAEKMNQTYTETTFSIVDSKTVEEKDERNITVTLCSPDFPGKIFTVYGYVTLGGDPSEFLYNSELILEPLENNQNQLNARMTIPNYFDTYYTDYYCQIYENEFREYLISKFGPVLENTTYKLAIKPSVYETNFCTVYNTSEDFIKTITYSKVAFLVNKELNSTAERQFNALAFTLTENPIIAIEPVFYFTTKFNAAAVSDNTLLEGNFYSENDASVTKKVVCFNTRF